jgi:hypothetical protein
MSRPSSTPIVTNAVLGCTAGLVAGFAMNLFVRVVNAATGGCEARGATNGRGRLGRGMQPPQALTRAEDDAAVAVGSAVAHLITQRRHTTPERLRFGTAAHYAFSAALGMSYLLLAQFAPAVRSRSGLVYGTAVWAVADEGAVPGLGLSRGPRQLPIGVHLYSLIGHWVFGATLESAARLAAVRIRETQSPPTSTDIGTVSALPPGLSTSLRRRDNGGVNDDRA